MKSGHCMLNQHKSQIDKHAQQKCEICLVTKTPTHYLLHCSKWDIQKAKVAKNISHVLRKNSLCPCNISTEESFGKYNFNTEESTTVRVELEKYFNSTKKIETEDSKPFDSQLYLDISSFFFLSWLVYNKKIK